MLDLRDHKGEVLAELSFADGHLAAKMRAAARLR